MILEREEKAQLGVTFKKIYRLHSTDVLVAAEPGLKTDCGIILMLKDFLPGSSSIMFFC